ncbi:CD109 antigen-like isoform X2 [Mya arenaria]|uniref:CD109 antigen-like isoform X2 n=1 Tax=Mya arenaria TaxID=6604 RepID=UPI0022E420E4|nr:CD109 antigen-like isoform X2 [Mya arenaria]
MRHKDSVFVVGVITLLQIAYSNAANSFIFVSPNVFRPGHEYIVHGKLLATPYGPVTITAKLFGKETVALGSRTTQDQSDIQINLQIPVNVTADSFRLEVSGTGGLTFKEVKDVSLETKVIDLYLQTDKPIYKPGQTVHFRVFGITSNLRVVFDKLKVELFDPKGNKINQWSVSGAELTSVGGVYVQEQAMSDQPILGTWKIKAKLLSYEGGFQEKTFVVDEYVLPKFEVKLDLPAFGRTQEKDFTGNIKATYTFGKPVKGEVELRIRPVRERFEWQNNARVKVSSEIEMKFPINGKASFTVATSRLEEVERFLDGNTLVFEANVTEGVTKLRQNDSQELTFYRQPIQLEFPKSLPETFKPGMTYDAVVKVSQRDGSPPDAVNGELRVTITEYRKPLPVRPKQETLSRSNLPGSLSDFRTRFMPPLPPPRRRTESERLPPVSYTIPADGIVEFSFSTDTRLESVNVEAEYNDASVSRTFKRRHSPSDNFLQLRSTTLNPTAWQDAEFHIKATERVAHLTYQVYSRGTLVDAGKILVSGKETTWRLPVTSSMAPRARVVAFYVRKNGEVVADSLTINVEGVFENKVSVSFNKTEAQPADKIRFDVKADVGSTVNVLGVDKSVLLLGTGNDITTSQVIGDLSDYSLKSKRTRIRPVCDWFCFRWPVSVGGVDTKDIFDDAGVLVFTDAEIYEHIPEPEILPIPMEWMMRAGGPMLMANDNMAEAQSMILMASAIPPAVPSSELVPVQRTRILFPETWLWRSEKVESNGFARIEETVPDTITSWIATAFAVHPDTGLGVAPESAQLQVSLPFFVAVNMPYSVIRGEKVILQVNIHNYRAIPLSTHVVLEKSEEFDNIIIDGTNQSRSSVEVRRIISVGSDEVVAVYFPIVAKTIGLIDISVRAQTTISADAVNKKLLVEAEGTPREYNVPFVVDLKTTGTQTKTVNVEYPLRTVVGSERVKVTAVADLMGPSISGLDKLLKLPTGCGEQNMLNFAPNIFIIKYLEATDNLDATIMNKAKKFMETGYQRELTYSHIDGSFSAFGESDKSGSTWLTAFVVKSFVQAMDYVFVDEKVIHKAVDWLIEQQNANGTFNEPGRVIHTDMQGGSIGGQTSLTAYVLISLLEARSAQGVATKISAAQAKSQTYLEGQISQITNVYDLAIVGYALQMAGSSKANDVWTKLDNKTIEQDGTKHWEKASQTTADSKPWESRTGKAVNVEITSYALLTLAQRKDTANGVQVLKWLTTQRNAQGGFHSTQDTVIALQGLSEIAALLFSKEFAMTIDISGKGYENSITIDNTNARVLQTRDLPADVGLVTITATGMGLALVQVEVSYNIDDDDQKKSFRLTVDVPRETANEFDVTVCASWLEEGSSSMALIEIGMPSGFSVDASGIVSKPQHKRIEFESRKIVIYFAEIGSGGTCVSATMYRSGLVAGAQPVAVAVLDYYDPGKQVTEFYVPKAVSGSEVCDVCGAECDFCRP